jgi:hypothetical protein
MKMKGIFAILGGLGAGAALMYLFDPNEGNRRRSLIRDKATSINNKTQHAVSGRVRDFSNRAKGLLHETKTAVSGSRGELGSEQTETGTAPFTGQESYNH